MEICNGNERNRLDNHFLDSLPGSPTLLPKHISGSALPAELKAAVFSKKKNKSPGVDGITYEFGQEFWMIISETLLQVANNILTEKDMLSSQGPATVRLLPKKVNAVLVKDFRPIYFY